LDASLYPAGDWAYAELATPLVLSVGQRYWVLSSETNGGDRWYGQEGVTPVLKVEFSARSSGRQSGYYDGTMQFGSAFSYDYGPVNFHFAGVVLPPLEKAYQLRPEAGEWTDRRR
jgi:hypothetical protein